MLKNKTILVCGATNGIGRQVVTHCTQSGATVVAVGRDDSPLRRLASELPEISRHNYFAERFDLEKTEQIGLFISSLCRKYGNIDAFVHASGLCVSRTFKDTSSCDFERIFKLSYMSLVEVTKALLHYNRKSPVCGMYVGAFSPFDFIDGVAPYIACCGAAVFSIYHFSREIDQARIRLNSVFPVPASKPLTELETKARLQRLGFAAEQLLNQNSPYPAGRVIEVTEKGEWQITTKESFGESQLWPNNTPA